MDQKKLIKWGDFFFTLLLSYLLFYAHQRDFLFSHTVRLNFHISTVLEAEMCILSLSQLMCVSSSVCIA